MKLPEKPKPLDLVKGLKNGIFAPSSILEKAKEYNKLYLYWSELKYRTTTEKERQQIWTIIKFLRSSKYEQVPFKAIGMKYYTLPDFTKKLHRFDKFLGGSIEIQQENLGLQKRYVISSLMEEAIASSMIEGAATTRKVAKAMLREQRKPINSSEKMIVNNYETMQFILTKKKEKLTPDLLSEIQKSVTKETLDNPEDEGRFRNSNDIVVGHQSYAELIAHLPPDYKSLPKLIQEFCDFANNEDGEFIHPILKGITLHFLLGYIHPFNDGNGRTARSVFYWYMLNNDYWLFEYMAVSRRILRSRKQYDLAYLYTEYDEMDLTYFFKYIIECIDDSLSDMLEYIKKKQAEQREAKKMLLKNPDLNLRQTLILEGFMKNTEKLFTVKEISETFKIVIQTARTDLLQLVKKGFITKRRSGKTDFFVLKE